MKQRLINTIMGLTVLGAGFAVAQEPDLKKTVDQQNAQIQELLKRVQQLETSQVDTSQIKKVVLETNQALADANKKIEKADSKLILGKNIDGLRLTGDLRLRYEMRDRNIDAAPTAQDGDRQRFRLRFRLGGIWTNKVENWEIGAGLATGDDNGGRSTNDTWADSHNSPFDHWNIWLDYVYAKHKWMLNETTPLTLTLGQQINPLFTTMLTWDGDLRPVGVTLQYGDPLGKNYTGAFATLGAYEVYWMTDGKGSNDYNTDNKLNDNVFLAAVQAGYKYVGEDNQFLAMAGFMTLNDAWRNMPATDNQWGNSNDPNNAWPAADTGYQYQIGELYGEYKTNLGGIEVKPYAHLAYNFGASGDKTQAKNLDSAEAADYESKDQRLGIMAGIDFKRGKWSAGYAYSYIQADAVFGPLRDSDFGETAGLRDTDIQGHLLRVGYQVTEDFTVSLTAYLLSRISDVKNNEADKAQMLQLDLSYKF